LVFIATFWIFYCENLCIYSRVKSILVFLEPSSVVNYQLGITDKLLLIHKPKTFNSYNPSSTLVPCPALLVAWLHHSHQPNGWGWRGLEFGLLLSYCSFVGTEAFSFGHIGLQQTKGTGLQYANLQG
jgi:hypothetical protein